MKTVRFKSVVARSGRPSSHFGWLPLNQDQALQAAIAANRVLTVHQVMRGGRKDFGTVGFTKEPQTQVLIFPKSLKKFREQRVVAIDYDLLADQAKAVPGRAPPLPTSRAPRRPIAPAVPSPTAAKAAVLPTKARPVVRIQPASVPEIPPPLTWTQAVADLEKIKRALKGRPAAIATQIESLLARAKERLRPH